MDRAPKQRDKSRRAEMIVRIAGGRLETEREIGEVQATGGV